MCAPLCASHTSHKEINSYVDPYEVQAKGPIDFRCAETLEQRKTQIRTAYSSSKEFLLIKSLFYTAEFM